MGSKNSKQNNNNQNKSQNSQPRAPLCVPCQPCLPAPMVVQQQVCRPICAPRCPTPCLRQQCSQPCPPRPCPSLPAPAAVCGTPQAQSPLSRFMPLNYGTLPPLQYAMNSLGLTPSSLPQVGQSLRQFGQGIPQFGQGLPQVGQSPCSNQGFSQLSALPSPAQAPLCDQINSLRNNLSPALNALFKGLPAVVPLPQYSSPYLPQFNGSLQQAFSAQNLSLSPELQNQVLVPWTSNSAQNLLNYWSPAQSGAQAAFSSVPRFQPGQLNVLSSAGQNALQAAAQASFQQAAGAQSLQDALQSGQPIAATGGIQEASQLALQALQSTQQQALQAGQAFQNVGQGLSTGWPAGQSAYPGLQNAQAFAGQGFGQTAAAGAAAQSSWPGWEQNVNNLNLSSPYGGLFNFNNGLQQSFGHQQQASNWNQLSAGFAGSTEANGLINTGAPNLGQPVSGSVREAQQYAAQQAASIKQAQDDASRRLASYQEASKLAAQTVTTQKLAGQRATTEAQNQASQQLQSQKAAAQQAFNPSSLQAAAQQAFSQRQAATNGQSVGVPGLAGAAGQNLLSNVLANQAGVQQSIGQNGLNYPAGAGGLGSYSPYSGLPGAASLTGYPGSVGGQASYPGQSVGLPDSSLGGAGYPGAAGSSGFPGTATQGLPGQAVSGQGTGYPGQVAGGQVAGYPGQGGGQYPGSYDPNGQGYAPGDLYGNRDRYNINSRYQAELNILDIPKYNVDVQVHKAGPKCREYVMPLPIRSYCRPTPACQQRALIRLNCAPKCASSRPVHYQVRPLRVERKQSSSQDSSSSSNSSSSSSSSSQNTEQQAPAQSSATVASSKKSTVSSQAKSTSSAQRQSAKPWNANFQSAQASTIHSIRQFQ